MTIYEFVNIVFGLCAVGAVGWFAWESTLMVDAMRRQQRDEKTTEKDEKSG